MSSKRSVTVHWFRRDLRLEDNRAFAAALADAASGGSVLPIFIFDPTILARLEDKDDGRVTFIHRTLAGLHARLRAKGSGLLVFHGKPRDVFRGLATGQWTGVKPASVEYFKSAIGEFDLRAVYTNRDDEPYARERDRTVEKLLVESGISFHSAKDQVIFDRDDVTKDDGKPYTVFTPYSKRWRATLDEKPGALAPAKTSAAGLLPWKAVTGEELALSLKDLGFCESSLEFPSLRVETDLLKRYAHKRNTPAIRGTSRLGIHLRFGTVSIRKLVRTALDLKADTWLSELIWREFFMQILWHFPQVVEHAFRPEYDRIRWRNDADEFEKWCQGKTGFPIVDAGMRELNATGFMHNRVRMIAGSFLVKHLLVDWRLGEAYFARKLLDFDLAANNGNWQWVAGSGCDAAPYFRVFNPSLQADKFDADSTYVKQWVPEFGSDDYFQPMVEHKAARARALAAYQAIREPR